LGAAQGCQVAGDQRLAVGLIGCTFPLRWPASPNRVDALKLMAIRENCHDCFTGA
jgi:hypothetical protein